MLYSKNINDISMLRAELKKLKALYAEALSKKESLPALQQLRTRIKHVASRINLIGSSSDNNNSKDLVFTQT